jgi:phosphoserine phosphatase RsbU/P
MNSFAAESSFNIIIVEIIQRTDANIADATIKKLNPAASHLLGYQSTELTGRPIGIIFGKGSPDEIQLSALHELFTKGTDYSFVCPIYNKAGQRIPSVISLSPLTAGKETTRIEIVLIIQHYMENEQPEDSLFIMHIAVEQSANAIMITNAQGKIEYVNPKFTDLTGYSKQELLGNNPKILQSGYTSPEYYQAIFESLLETGEWRGEIKNKKKNGEFYWAYECISVVKNERGEITHFIAIVEDKTQRRQVESALRESEERFRQMADMTGEWLWEQDPEGFYIYSSAAVQKILGFSPDEILGKHYLELLTSNDKATLQPSANIQEPFYALINHYRHRDGHQVYAESTGLPIKNDAGQLIKWRGVDRDITARKHFQDALIESEKRKRLIVDSALNAIIIMDSYGMITDWNPRAESMFGWTSTEAVGQRLADLIVPTRYRKKHTAGLQKFLHNGRGPILNKITEITALRRDGSEFPAELSVSPLKLGNAYVFSGFVHDITARKEAENKIRQTQVKLAISQNELNIAHQIQRSLFPAESITTDDFAVTGFCLPADQVGGDYFDYFFRDSNNLDIVIADVSGHAIGPALFMVETRSALRTQAKWPGTPGGTLGVLNSLLFTDLDNADYFITMFYLQYNTLDEQLKFACAGHPSAIYWNKSENHCKLLDADGLILGIRKEVVFEEKTISIKHGDMILLYTDGFVEAENPTGEFFGVQRLLNHLHQCSSLPPQQIIENIIAELKQFCQTDTFIDDMTMVIFKRNESSGNFD